ncbi:MAG: two-component system response regulator RstA [Phenylobacterium sp.]|jgi:two-component system response regulator RstA
MSSIILVEDDVKLSSLVQKYLQQQGFDVTVIGDGNLATQAILSQQPEVVILDLMLPGKDGLTICREVRPNFAGNILFLTASEDDMDHVAGVELGADDFIVKPIQPRVLLARIRMLLRRSEKAATPVAAEAATPTDNMVNNPAKKTSSKDLTFGQLTIHLSKRQVILDQQKVPLTTSEFDLLALLANHAEEVLSRDFIYKTLRGIEYDGMDRAMDTKVANLRKKLGDNASMSTRIITVRGQGYLFVPDSWV